MSGHRSIRALGEYSSVACVRQRATAAFIGDMLGGGERKEEQANVPSCLCTAFQHRAGRRDLVDAPSDQRANIFSGRRRAGPDTSRLPSLVHWH